jgi:hypothetical protein
MMPLRSEDFNQYSTIDPYIDPASKPGWVADPVDQMRLASYELYSMIYRNVQDTFALVQHGSDANPIYIPEAKKCIEATNRYLGVGLSYSVDGSSGDDRNTIRAAFESLFRREKFFAKFAGLKRGSLIKGDGLYHVIGDDTKPPGRRLSIHGLNPAKYHPIFDYDDPEKLVGVHLVEPYVDPADKNKSLVRRQTYRKDDTGPKTVITSEETIFEADGWDDRQPLLNPSYKMKPYRSIKPQFTLPDLITSIPVYHVPNQYNEELTFGDSELVGFERIIAAINQGITDEELALAYGGLGLFFTTAARPSSGWVIPPGSVVDGEAGETFNRVNGLNTVSPSLDHLNWIDGEMKQAMGTPDIAVGKVDVQIAQSGIALAFQMGPILTRNKEKEQTLLALHDHLFWDLANGWFPAYEQTGNDTVSVPPSFDDPMPKDRAAIIKEVLDLMSTTPPIISAEYARTMLAERLGMEFPDKMGDTIIAEIKNASSAQWSNSIEERIQQELAAGLGEEGISVNGSAG